MRDEIALDQAMDYYDAVVRSDINRADNVQKNPERVRRLMRSYARNQGGQVPNTVLARDVAANDESPINEETVASYLNSKAAHSHDFSRELAAFSFPYFRHMV